MKSPTSNKRGWRYWLKLLLVGLNGGLVMFYIGSIVLGVSKSWGSEPFDCAQDRRWLSSKAYRRLC